MGAGVIHKHGGSRRRRRARPRPMSEINVTPFVDVMLVLLIIFMVAAPLLTVGVDVELPETVAEALPTEAEEPLTVTMTADGRVLLQANETPPADLVGQLRAVAAERASDRIYLRADGQIPYDRVAQVMASLNAAGFLKIGLVHDADGPAGSAAAGGQGG